MRLFPIFLAATVSLAGYPHSLGRPRHPIAPVPTQDNYQDARSDFEAEFIKLSGRAVTAQRSLINGAFEAGTQLELTGLRCTALIATGGVPVVKEFTINATLTATASRIGLSLSETPAELRDLPMMDQANNAANRETAVSSRAIAFYKESTMETVYVALHAGGNTKNQSYGIVIDIGRKPLYSYTAYCK